jgi:hypothetical protein
MDDFSQLSVGGIFALMVLKTVFDFVQKMRMRGAPDHAEKILAKLGEIAELNTTLVANIKRFDELVDATLETRCQVVSLSEFTQRTLERIEGNQERIERKMANKPITGAPPAA